ncbi:MAG: hypothetical protein WC310_04655 [Patescibacteria group bacterium]|jgi:protein-disulfide isomerase
MKALIISCSHCRREFAADTKTAVATKEIIKKIVAGCVITCTCPHCNKKQRATIWFANTKKLLRY